MRKGIMWLFFWLSVPARLDEENMRLRIFFYALRAEKT